jgi:hypothetical protein
MDLMESPFSLFIYMRKEDANAISTYTSQVVGCRSGGCGIDNCVGTGPLGQRRGARGRRSWLEWRILGRV